MRKPERRIYEHTLCALNVDPSEVVYLDDFGTNLKTARDLGMRTIKVYYLLTYLFNEFLYLVICAGCTQDLRTNCKLADYLGTSCPLAAVKQTKRQLSGYVLM